MGDKPDSVSPTDPFWIFKGIPTMVPPLQPAEIGELRTRALSSSTDPKEQLRVYLCGLYAAAAADGQQCIAIIEAAMRSIRSLLPDFDVYIPAMLEVGLSPDWARVLPGSFIAGLYAAGKLETLYKAGSSSEDEQKDWIQ